MIRNKKSPSGPRVPLVCRIAGRSRRRPIVILLEGCTLQRRIVPTGGRKIPARPRDSGSFIHFALDARCRRIRLLRVHSHSHGEEVVCVVKRVACKSPGAVSALGFGFAGVFCRVCRLHGAVFLPFSGVSSPESMFVSSYQNSFVFSSENQQKRAVVTEMHKMFEIEWLFIWLYIVESGSAVAKSCNKASYRIF